MIYIYIYYVLDMVFYCIYFWWGQSGVFSRSNKNPSRENSQSQP